MTDAERICQNVKSNCVCMLPPGHESPHLCGCAGSWTRGDNAGSDDDVIRFPSGSVAALDNLAPAWNGSRWAFCDRAGAEVDVLSLTPASAPLPILDPDDPGPIRTSKRRMP